MTRRKAAARGPVRLRFAGEVPVDGSALGLPEGWPATEHEERDPAVAAEKLASKFYELADEVEVSHGDGTQVVP